MDLSWKLRQTRAAKALLCMLLAFNILLLPLSAPAGVGIAQ
jgi:hypothetical protein